MGSAPAADLFSANLGFLWTELDLQSAVRAARDAGFTAIELHQPYDVPVNDFAALLSDLDMTVVSMNTGVGDPQRGEMGLAAVAGREADARRLLDQAIEYAAVIGSRFVSVVVGRSSRNAEAETVLRDNLAYASQQAAQSGVDLLLEPLNTGIAEDLHLVRVADAVSTIDAVGADNIFVMADTFHVLTMEDSLEVIRQYLDRIGHIQISGWPDRGEPDMGIGLDDLVPELRNLGYGGSFGAEYIPRRSVEAGLGWFRNWGTSDHA